MRTRPGNVASWQLGGTTLGLVVSGLLIEGFAWLLPRVQGKRRGEAWVREMLWLTAMGVSATLAYTIVAWGIRWITHPLLWISSACMGALGWFLGDMVQQYFLYRQTGMRRGIGGR